MDNTVAELDRLKNSIVRDVSSKYNIGGASTPLTTSLSDMLPKEKPKQSFTESSYERPSDLYQTLNDGTKVAKYESYIPGTNNEERLAQGQSTSDKWVNGLEKLVLKTGNVVLGNTLGFVNGFVEAAQQGSMDAIYDNSFTKTLDDWNTKLDYKLPNYYTQQEKSAGFGDSLGSANFWANDVLAGTAFTLGTVASEAIWAYATGGASLALRGARIGAKVGTGVRAAEETLSGINKFKSFLKQPLRNAAKGASAGGILNREGAIMGSRIGEGLNTLRFGLTSASGEAAVEAWHYKKEAKEHFYDNFEEINGRPPTTEEGIAFETNLSNSANAVFATNYMLVGGANLAFFGGQFGIKNPLKNLTKSFDKTFFGIGTETVETTGKKTIQALKANRFQNAAGKSYGVSKNLFNEVMLEEGLQGVTTKTANKWLESTYDKKYAGQNLDMMGMVYESMAEQYGTKEGWKELGTAALTTLIGGAATGNLFGEIKGVDRKRESMAKDAKGLNTFSGDTFVKRFAMANQIQGAQERQAEANAKGDIVGGEIARHDVMFSRLHFNHNIKRETSEDIEDLQTSMELMTEEQFKDAGVSPENIEQFKSNTITEYKNLSESYTKNREFAEAITGAGQFVGGKEAGLENKGAIVEALAYNLTMGEVSGGLQNDLLTAIKTEILGNFSQTSSFTNALDIDNILKNASAKTTKEFNYTKDKITKTEHQKKALEKELVELERNKNSKEDNTAYNQRYANIAGRLIELNNEYAELVKKRNTLLHTAKIENPFIKNDSSVSEEDINNTEGKLGELNEMIDNLEETNPVAHAKISKLIEEYNKSVTQFKEFDTAAKALSSKSYKPKDHSSFLSKIINGKQSMDEFTKDFLLKAIQDYDATKRAYLNEDANDINNDISNEEYETFEKDGTVSEELLDAVARKVKSGEKLLPREEEVYNSKKDEVDTAVKLIADAIEVNPQDAIDAQIAELEKERDAKIAEVEKIKTAASTITNSLKGAEDVKSKLGHLENQKRFDEFIKLLKLGKSNLTKEQIDAILKGLSNNAVAIVGGTTDVKRNGAERGDLDTAWVDNPSNLSGVELQEFNAALSKLFLWIQSDNNTRQQPETADRDGAGGIVEKPTSSPIFIGDIVREVLEGEISPATAPAENSKEDTQKITDEYQTKINALKNGGLSETELLEQRIKDAFKEHELSMTYVGETYDDKVNKQPTQEEIAEYEEYLEKIQGSKRKDKNFAVRVDPKFATGTKAEIGLTNEELIKFQALNFKLAQWRMLDGAVTGENESIADLIELLNQLKTVLAEKATKSELTKQEIIDLLETEEMKTAKDATQNSFTQVHDVVTAKVVTEGGVRAVRFSDLNIGTIITNLNEIPTIIDPAGNKGEVTKELIEEFGKKEGTKFIFEGAVFTVGPKGRISISEGEFNTISGRLNLTPLSTNLNHSTYSPVYSKLGEETELIQATSDFIPQSTNENTTMPYTPDALYDTIDGEVVRFQVRLDDTYNAKLIKQYQDSKKTKKDKEYLEANLVIYTIKDGSGETTGSLKATNSSVKGSDTEFLRIRAAAMAQVMDSIKKGSPNVTLTVPVTVRAKRVILGIPNMAVTQTEDGYEPVNNDFNEATLGTVVNTGYMLDGKSHLSKDDKGVRFDFTTKLSKGNPTKKVPIIVFEYRGQKVAFPVTLISTPTPKGTQVTDILESEATEVEKVKQINKLLIENGIEPSKIGLTSLDGAKVRKAIAEMDLLEDFVDVDSLADKDYDKNLLIAQAQIAIKLDNRPIGAPKLVLDLASLSEEKVEEGAAEEQQVTEEEGKAMTNLANIVSQNNKKLIGLKSTIREVENKIADFEGSLITDDLSINSRIEVNNELEYLGQRLFLLENQKNNFESENEALNDSIKTGIVSLSAEDLEEVLSKLAAC